MYTDTIPDSEDFDLSFKVFHELMPNKVTEILLVSSPYEAFIMEEVPGLKSFASSHVDLGLIRRRSARSLEP
jgi:hypothetical protein